jgi:hypothetical protein
VSRAIPERRVKRAILERRVKKAIRVTRETSVLKDKLDRKDPPPRRNKLRLSP